MSERSTSEVDTVKLPAKVSCVPIFKKVYRYRTRSGQELGWSTLKRIWECKHCRMWSSFRDSFSSVCSKRDRRKKERRVRRVI